MGKGSQTDYNGFGECIFYFIFYFYFKARPEPINRCESFSFNQSWFLPSLIGERPGRAGEVSFCHQRQRCEARRYGTMPRYLRAQPQGSRSLAESVGDWRLASSKTLLEGSGRSHLFSTCSSALSFGDPRYI
jgi:hypothetical protein